MDEETRAAEYRAQRRRRRQFERDNAVRMRGSKAKADEVREAWQPVIDAANDQKRTESEEKEVHDRSRWTPA